MNANRVNIGLIFADIGHDIERMVSDDQMLFAFVTCTHREVYIINKKKSYLYVIPFHFVCEPIIGREGDGQQCNSNNGGYCGER